MAIILTLDEIRNDSIWVAKFCSRPRMVGKYSEIKDYLSKYDNDEDLRDLDVCCVQQREDLQKFWNGLFEYQEHTKGFVTIDDYYPIYVKENTIDEDDNYNEEEYDENDLVEILREINVRHGIFNYEN